MGADNRRVARNRVSDRPLRIEDIAGAVGRSESYLTKLFRREFSMSPGDYVRSARIDAAKELL